MRSQTLPRNIGAQARRSIFERLESEAGNRYGRQNHAAEVNAHYGTRIFFKKSSCLPLSHCQSAEASGLQTQTEAFSEFWGVERQQHQTDSSGVVPLQDYWLPGKTFRNKPLVGTRSSVLLVIVDTIMNNVFAPNSAVGHHMW